VRLHADVCGKKNTLIDEARSMFHLFAMRADAIVSVPLKSKARLHRNDAMTSKRSGTNCPPRSFDFLCSLAELAEA
jgi:hypothetical protein